MAQSGREANEKEKDTLAFRVGGPRRKRFTKLAQQANYETPSHFFKALVDQLSAIKGPFDVRDLQIVSGSGTTSDRPATTS